MARNGVFSRRRRAERVEEFEELLPLTESTNEVHVLAVDDSLVDRIVIERLLKITSCKGNFFKTDIVMNFGSFSENLRFLMVFLLKLYSDYSG